MDALFGELDMDDKIAEVQKDPSAFSLTLTTNGLDSHFMQTLFDAIDHCSDLTIVGCRAQQKYIGDDQLLTHVESDDVLRQLV